MCREGVLVHAQVSCRDLLTLHRQTPEFEFLWVSGVFASSSIMAEGSGDEECDPCRVWRLMRSNVVMGRRFGFDPDVCGKDRVLCVREECIECAMGTLRCWKKNDGIMNVNRLSMGSADVRGHFEMKLGLGVSMWKKDGVEKTYDGVCEFRVKLYWDGGFFLSWGSADGDDALLHKRVMPGDELCWEGMVGLFVQAVFVKVALHEEAGGVEVFVMSNNLFG